MFCYDCARRLDLDDTFCFDCGPRWLLTQNSPCADVLVTYHQQVLLIQRADDKSWCTPGGHVDQKEHPYQAAMRELKEEVGLIPTSLPTFLGVYLHDKGRTANQVTIYTYEAADPYWGTWGNVNMKEVADVQWFNHWALPEPRAPFVTEAVKDRYFGR